MGFVVLTLLNSQLMNSHCYDYKLFEELDMFARVLSPYVLQKNANKRASFYQTHVLSCTKLAVIPIQLA